jgi:plastocyanin
VRGEFSHKNSLKEMKTMRKHVFYAALSLAVILTVVNALMVSPTRARSEDAKSASAEVKVDNFTFSPGTLAVPVNSTITWVNKDDIPHVIASNDGLFKSKALDTDQKYSFTFSKPGTYAYYCSIHPKMVGKIVVQ